MQFAGAQVVGVAIAKDVVQRLGYLNVASTLTDNDGEFGFMVAKIEPGRHPWAPEQRRPTDGIEDKYRFVRYIEQLEKTKIHHGATHN